MAPEPSGPALRVSSRTRLSTLRIWSSAESSMVMMRSSRGMKLDKALRKVVLPEPVPPLTKMLYRARTSSSSTWATSGVMEP